MSVADYQALLAKINNLSEQQNETLLHAMKTRLLLDTLEPRIDELEARIGELTKVLQALSQKAAPGAAR